MEQPSSEIEGSLRAIHCCPPFQYVGIRGGSPLGIPAGGGTGGGGDISGDEGDGAQMAGRTILDRNDVRKWAEEVHQRLTKRA